jgi:uncharacterized protein YaiL (DUF2058 family)
MANSLQEQLLKAGLVSETQLNKSKKQEHRAKKRGSGRKTSEAAKAAVAQRQRQKAEQDAALNAKREAKQKEQELRLQIREMVLSNALPVEAGADVPYNMVRNGRIRRIYVTAAQRDQIVAGTLAVATARGRHHLIPVAVAERISALMPSYFVFRAEAEAAPDEPDENDPYAEFKVPDDLTW